LRTLLIATVLVFLCCTSFALEFRKSSWMMTRDEVVASEPGRVVSEKSDQGRQQIVYRTTVGGMPASVTYTLEKDRLLSASYTFKRDPSRKAFDFMRQDLVSQKGAPSFEGENLVGWRLEHTEIALAHFSDGTSYVAYWEKEYFARMNKPVGVEGVSAY
jgi:hypothetical protein